MTLPTKLVLAIEEVAQTLRASAVKKHHTYAAGLSAALDAAIGDLPIPNIHQWPTWWAALHEAGMTYEGDVVRDAWRWLRGAADEE